MLRSLLASITGLVAAVLLPLSLVSVWVHGVVSDTDTYVDTVTPLADDDAVKTAAVTELQREALRLVARAGATLPPGAGTVVAVVVRGVVDSPAFRAVWVDANRSAHDQVVAVLERRGDAHLDSRGRVTIDLSTALDTVVRDLAAQGLPVPDTTRVNASFAVLDAEQLTKARRAYDALDELRFWLPVLWLVTVALTLLLARRRLATTARLAVASLATLGLLAVALSFARDAVTDDLPQRDVALAVWDVVVRTLWHELEAGAVALGLVAVAAGVLALLAGRRRSAARTFSDGAAAYG